MRKDGLTKTQIERRRVVRIIMNSLLRVKVDNSTIQQMRIDRYDPEPMVSDWRGNE